MQLLKNGNAIIVGGSALDRFGNKLVTNIGCDQQSVNAWHKRGINGNLQTFLIRLQRKTLIKGLFASSR